jgi:hypothetical protein
VGLDEGKAADEDENSVRKKESGKGELEILRLGTEVSSNLWKTGGGAESLEMTTQTKKRDLNNTSKYLIYSMYSVKYFNLNSSVIMSEILKAVYV